MNIQELSLSRQSLMLIGLTLDGDHFLEKLACLSDKNKIGCEQFAREFLALDQESKRRELTKGFKRLHSEKRRGTFNAVHPDWILKKIINEPPYLISVLLRFLPSEYIKHIIKKLPESTVAAMPKLKDTFHVEAALVDFLRKKLEAEFESKVSYSGAGLRSTLYSWPLDKINVFFRELGFYELAMAFSTLPQKVSKALLSRMSATDGEEVARRMESKFAVSDSRIKKAQGHVLALDLSAGPARQLVIETGFYIYSRTLIPPLGPEFIALERKFSEELAAVLRKYAEKNIQINFPETVEPYIEELEFALAQFESKWKHLNSENTAKHKKEVGV